MNLKKENPRRMLWEKIPFPVTFKAYLFNITNPLEFIVGGKVWQLSFNLCNFTFLVLFYFLLQPRVQEIGPYVFE